MYIKSISSDCGANKWAISVFFTCTTGMKNENKKNKKNFSENDLYHRAKFSEKIFTKKIEKRQRSGGRVKKGYGLL